MLSGLWRLISTLAGFGGGPLLLLLGLASASHAQIIITQPQSNQFAFVGGSVSFSVSATNFTGATFNRNSNGAKTNVYYTGRPAGTVTNKYDFYGVGDRITMYYGGSQIYDTGQVSGKGNFSVGYGPGTDQFVTVIVNEGNNYTPSDWEYKLSMLAPLYYQWYGPAGLIYGATNATYTITNVQTNQAGNYGVLVSDTGSPVGSAPATLTVSPVAVYGNGAFIASTQYTFAGSVSVQIQTGYANGSIYYTLDGTTPTVISPRYTVPFVLTTNTTLRAQAFNSDFTQSGEGWPVAFTKVSGFTLTAATAGGGTITLNPTNGIYLSNTVVNLTATPDAGWTFLGWLGDASGNSSTNSVIMNRDRYVEAIFGTSLNTTTNISGVITLEPIASLYPFGTVVRVTATPLAGQFFTIWGGAANGDVNPLYFPVTNANQTISAGFPAVPAGQAALTVAATGFGQVTVTPRANRYGLGTNVTLTAVPESGQTFLGWTNDASGTNNPLIVAMTTNKLITANFTKRSALTDTAPLGGMTAGGLRLLLAGELGGRFQLEASTNLTNWAALTLLTNLTGRTQFTDPGGTNTPIRFYRAVQLP